MKRNPILVYLFEVTNILGCLIYPMLLLINPGGMFYPDGMAYQEEELLHCMKNMVTASVIFAIAVGIPLLLLFVDCFVIMKGVVGFKVTILSILTAPASYPIVRTEVLKEPKAVRRFHVIAGALIFISNSLVVMTLVQYGIRIAAAGYAVL
mgnify:CR=1 FL=1